jgi:hypothetical protein
MTDPEEVTEVYAYRPQARVLDALLQERARQDFKWGEQNHPDGTESSELAKVQADQFRMECDSAASVGKLTWKHILLEEVYEAFAESDPKKLRTELVQSAAVIMAWIEAIDRRSESA